MDDVWLLIEMDRLGGEKKKKCNTVKKGSPSLFPETRSCRYYVLLQKPGDQGSTPQHSTSIEAWRSGVYTPAQYLHRLDCEEKLLCNLNQP